MELVRDLGLTDTNLCGALDFARQANAPGLRPITGGELILACGSRLTLLARTREGYGNLSRLFTLANAAGIQALRQAQEGRSQAGVVQVAGSLSSITTDLGRCWLRWQTGVVGLGHRVMVAHRGKA